MLKKSILVMTLSMLSVPLAAQEVHRISGDEVAVYNLAGHVEVVRGSGSDVVVRVDRGGSDAQSLQIETGRVGGRETLRVVYPDEQIIYPELGRGSRTTTRVRADGTFSDGGESRGDRVDIRGEGRGTEAWADLVVEVPDGRDVSIFLAVGEVEASGVGSDLRIDTGSGEVTATDIQGSVLIDTGSGNARVRGVTGSLRVDTGSGDVFAEEVTGEIIDLDTGSGRITASGMTAERLRADTGSGSVELSRVSAPDIVVDTGSGSIDVEILTDVRSLEVDTGSGSVTLRVPDDIGARIEVETGSGGIDSELPIEVRSIRRDRLVGTLGDGRGSIEVDTGSGSVRLLRSGGRL